MNAIYDALTKLDVKSDDHWTNEGLPKVDVVKQLSGLFSLTREQITSTAPGYTRDNVTKQLETKDEPIVATAAVAPLAMDTATAEVLKDIALAVMGPPDSDEQDAIALAKDDLATLRAVEAEQAILAAEAHKAFVQAREAADQMELEVHKLESAQPHRPQNEIQLYLESQKRLRAERAAKIQQTRPDTRAPIDRALGKGRTKYDRAGTK